MLVLVHTCPVGLMDMDVGNDLILGWDWISSHDLLKVYVDCHICLRSGPTWLLLDLLPAEASPIPHTPPNILCISLNILHAPLITYISRQISCVFLTYIGRILGGYVGF